MQQGLPDSILGQQQDAYMRSLIMQRQQMESNLARTGDQSAWAPAIQSGFENASALGNADMVRQFRQEQLDYPMNIAFQWRGSRKGANYQSPQRPGVDWGGILGGIGSTAGGFSGYGKSSNSSGSSGFNGTYAGPNSTGFPNGSGGTWM
jgi:hypothetical protein